MKTEDYSLQKIDEIFSSAQPEELFQITKPFLELMMHNQCALKEIETKLQVLDLEFSSVNNRNPIETIKTRIKSPVSIVEKLKRKGYEITIENMRRLNDIAGIRVICSYPEDIYMLCKMLSDQDDLRVIQIKDYIKNPKKNGYRSLHMIVEVPIFLSREKKYMRVEVQFRTIAMDFWASLEHKMKYKKNIEDAELISRELKECAELISRIDMYMQQISNKIKAAEDLEQEDNS